MYDEMRWTTHFLFAVLAAYLFAKEQGGFVMGLVLLGSFLPDIDHPQSKLGSKIKWVGWLSQHRGFWHTPFAMLAVSSIVIVLTQVKMGVGFGIGYASHIILDTLTIKGVMLFYPFTRKRITGPIETGSISEGLFFVLLFITLLIILWN